jgi:hypothetical protein
MGHIGYESLLLRTMAKITRALLAIQANELIQQPAHLSPFLPGLRANKEAVM